MNKKQKVAQKIYRAKVPQVSIDNGERLCGIPAGLPDDMIPSVGPYMGISRDWYPTATVKGKHLS